MPDYYGTGIYGTAVYDTIPTPPTPPANTVAPAVTGTTQVGLAVSCTTGTWTDAGHISYAYQWQDSPDGVNWTNIASATSSTYTIPSTEAFLQLRCVVTDTDANGATAANSNTAGPVFWPAPTNTVAPVLSGVVQVNSALTTTNGTWTDDGSPSFSYQWQFSPNGVTGWSNVSGNTLYLIQPGQETGYIQCIVTNNDTGGATSSTSNVLGPISAAPVVGLLLVPVPSGALILTPAVRFP